MNRHRVFSLFCIFFGFFSFSEVLHIIRGTDNLAMLIFLLLIGFGITFLFFRQARLSWKKGGKPSSEL
jgi:hypothetical protein